MALEQLAAGKLLEHAQHSRCPVLAVIVRPNGTPSRSLLASFAALEESALDGIEAVQVDMDEDPEVMNQLRVAYEPELILFDQGRIIERTDGDMNSRAVASFIKHALSLR